MQTTEATYAPYYREAATGSITCQVHLSVPPEQFPVAGYNVTVTRQFTIVPPASIYFEPTIGAVKLFGDNGYGSPTDFGLQDAVRASTMTLEDQGIIWDTVVVNPTGYGLAGGWNWIQIGVSTRFYVNNSGQRYAATGNNTLGLDGHYPYDPDPVANFYPGILEAY